MRKAPRRRGEAWRADGCMREAVARLFPLKAEGDQAKGDADVKWVVAPIKPVCVRAYLVGAGRRGLSVWSTC